jgi:hypothetical protein
MIGGLVNIRFGKPFKNNFFPIPFAKDIQRISGTGLKMIEGAPFGGNDKGAAMRGRLAAIQSHKPSGKVRIGIFRLKNRIVTGGTPDVHLLFLVRMNLSVSHDSLFRVTVDTVHADLPMMDIAREFYIIATAGKNAGTRRPFPKRGCVSFRFKAAHV